MLELRLYFLGNRSYAQARCQTGYVTLFGEVGEKWSRCTLWMTTYIFEPAQRFIEEHSPAKVHKRRESCRSEKSCLPQCKLARKVVYWSAASSSILLATFSSASLASTLSVVGLPGTIPLGGVGGCFALASPGKIIASKKLDHLSRNTKRFSHLP